MAKDAYHENVKNALIKDGWEITHDPYVLKYKDLTVFADLGAEKFFANNENKDKIVVEIKVFGSKSKTTEFEKAKGQYDIYLFAMRKNQIDGILFLAVSTDIYESVFLRPSIREIVAEERINLLIFDVKKEEIVRWINWQNIEI
ncbi:MAG: element excision factor XisH family protein [Aridibacter sp.]